jgi:uncharacterized RDD family membrane protein YckC
VHAALLEAEEDHFLDCPDADFLQRTAALVLDAILCWIMYTGIKHSCAALGTYLISWLDTGGASPEALPLSGAENAVKYVTHVLQLSLLYLYLVWSVSYYGGTPAKLMLGMRVVNASTGQRLSLPMAMLRELVGKAAGAATLGVGFWLPLIRADKRAMHDLMTTSVVKKVHGGP